MDPVKAVNVILMNFPTGKKKGLKYLDPQIYEAF